MSRTSDVITNLNLQLHNHSNNLKSYIKYIKIEIKRIQEILNNKTELLSLYDNRIIELKKEIKTFEKIKIIVHTSEYQNFIQNKINELKRKKNIKLYKKYQIYDLIYKIDYVLNQTILSKKNMILEYTKINIKCDQRQNKRRRLY
jgi:hypothetical protein